jgi:hypothetical protein
MTISSIQSGYGMNYQEKNSNNTFKETVAEVPSSTKVIDYIQVPNEEVKNLYLTNKETNLMKSKIEIYLDIENKELAYEETSGIKKLHNRNNLLEYYKEEVRMEKDTLKYEGWA